MSRSYVVVANRAAGSTNDDTLNDVREILGGKGPAQVVMTTNAEDLDAVITNLYGATLVVAGGDGSLHAAVNAMHRVGANADTTIGLVPLGTGNDFARTVGVPLDARRAASRILDARPHPMDVLREEDGLVAVNAVHLGVGAEAARLAASAKQRLGAAGYAVGALFAGLRYSGWREAVTVDGTLIADEHVLMVAISQGRTIGGGTELAPDARPDDGLADVTVSASTGPFGRLAFGWRLRHGTHRERPDVSSARGVRVTVHGDALRSNVDGEILPARDHWTWTVRRAAWRLLLP